MCQTTGYVEKQFKLALTVSILKSHLIVSVESVQLRLVE
jgi:hypothetical protein